jgi:lysophospholipase L1-like esterase
VELVPTRRASLRSLPVVALLVLASLTGAGGGRATADSEPATYYVSLGDSLARGWQPDSSGHSHSTLQGYVDVVAAALGKTQPGLQSIKFGCPGETTRTMIAGGSCHYAAGSELAQAEAFLKAHRGSVSAVTVNIGDNDVEQCLAHARIDAACVNRELVNVRARLPQIVARLRAAAGAQVPIAGLTDYDQFLSYWLDGPSGQSLARRSVGVVDRLNRSADLIYKRGGVRVADATRAFATLDLTHLVSLRGHGRVPLAVQRVCLWTWACSPPPIGANDHANATGYRVLGQVLLAALRR